MKINEKTIELLTNFSDIDQAIKFQGNCLTIRDVNKKIYAYAEIEDNFENQVAIYNLKAFLGIYKFYKDREVDYDFKEKSVTIKSGRTKTVYNYCNPDIIQSPPPCENAGLDPEDVLVNFSLPEQTLKEIKTMSGILDVEDISIVGKKGDLYITIYDVKKQNSKPLHEIKIGNCETEFIVLIKLINLLKILNGEYTVEVRDNIIHFKNVNQKLEYFIATNILE